MAEHEDPFERVVETLKEPVPMGPDFTARVMAEVARLPAPARHRLAAPFAWLRRRWTIRLSPAGGLAAAAGLAAVVFAGIRLVTPGTPSDPAIPAGGAGSAPRTQFVLVAPGAASVAVVGDFNDWSLAATPLARSDGNGVWWVTLPLPPGRYRYSFVVDGTTWLRDPDAPAVEDEFGVPNSVVTIGGP